MAALHERDHHRRTAARLDSRARAAGGGLNLDVGLRAKKNTQATAPAAPPAPMGAGWLLALAGLVFIAMHAASSSASASHSGRGLGSHRRSGFGAASLIGYAETVDDIKAMEQMDQLLNGGYLETLLADASRQGTGGARSGRQQTCTTRSCPVGTKVVLSPDYSHYADAADGPLGPDHQGTVVNVSPRWLTVQAAGYELGWMYKKQALSPAAAARTSNVDASEMSNAEMTHTYPEMKLPKHAPTVAEPPSVFLPRVAAIAVCIVLLAAGGGIAMQMRKKEQERLNIQYEQREAARVLELAKYREQQVAELRAARITRELEGEVARKELARMKGAAVSCQRIFRHARGVDDATLSARARAAAADAAVARAGSQPQTRGTATRRTIRPSWASLTEDGSDPLNGGAARFTPTQTPGEPVIVGL